MRKTPEQLIQETRPERPNRILYAVVQAAARFIALLDGAKYVYHFDKREVRGKQVLLISDHSSRREYIYTIGGFPFSRMNIVVGYPNAFVKAFPLMLKMGFIFKKNLQPEIKPLKDLLSLVRKGASILLYPEGTQSVTGTTMPVLKSTAKLMKKIGLPVVLCKSYGAYFMNPDHNPNGIKGHQEFHYEMLFTPEELAEKDCDTLYTKLMDRFRFNDSEWILGTDHRYRCKQGLAEGLDAILYRCPHCHSEGKLTAQKDTVRCAECGYTVRINDRYRFERTDVPGKAIHETIPEWYEAQRDSVRKELESDGFSLSFDCTRVDLITDHIAKNRFRNCEKGTLTLTKENLTYTSEEDPSQNRVFEIDTITDFNKYKVIDGFEMYYNGEYFAFCSDTDQASSTKMVLAELELRCMGSDIWQEAIAALGKK